VTYSYTQISQYVACPRKYRYRYLDGWQEKDTRAAMIFGRVFEDALQAYFRQEDWSAAFIKRWNDVRSAHLEYKAGDSWQGMLEQGLLLLEKFGRHNRIQICEPRRHLQAKLCRQISVQNDFVAYIDALGILDGKRCLIEWKTTASRYPDQPEGLLALDPQLVCYSWISDISEVAMVVFVRKRAPEIQYLRTKITQAQRQEFGMLVEEAIHQIETAHFLPHSGIRFPQNGCVSCPYLGLCLANQKLIAARLTRRAGASELDWLNELD
jgi:CRISPR/Cas system-associated exonuclease Cas4 (RecB family)